MRMLMWGNKLGHSRGIKMVCIERMYYFHNYSNEIALYVCELIQFNALLLTRIFFYTMDGTSVHHTAPLHMNSSLKLSQKSALCLLLMQIK